MNKIVYIIFNFFFISVFSTDNQNLKKTYYPIEINSTDAPKIDGLIDDSIWSKAQWENGFVELEPNENTIPSYDTSFKILYDKKHLYIAIKAIDSLPDQIVNRLSRRDQFDGDKLMVAIDSYHDLRTAYMFGVSVAGVKMDMIASDNGQDEDISWDPIWDVKTHIDKEAWYAEYKIPFNQVRFDNSENNVWGFNIMREIFRENEKSVWNRVPADSPGWVSESGELKGLNNISNEKQIDIRPFLTSKLDTYEKQLGNPYKDGNDFTLNAGLDAKFGITNNLTLDITINPDFGQIEADPSQISLDGFEIFLEERRPFFVESKNIFNYRLTNRDNLFFSRRLGRAPQGRPNTIQGEYYDQPTITKILGAAKFSGKTNNGWSIGILESITSNEYAKISNDLENRRDKVEPMTNYFVGRIQKDFNENSSLGGIFTSTNRSKLSDNLNFLHKSAYSAGVDFKHQWRNKKYFIDSKIVISKVNGSRESILNTQTSITHLFQRIDASHIDVDPTKTSLTGTNGIIDIGKQSEGNWTYGAGFNWYSPELEINDIGYLRQADLKMQTSFIGYKTLKSIGKLRSFRGTFEQFTTYDFEGNHNRTQYSFDSSLTLNNNMSFNMGVTHKPRIFINTYLQGGPRFRYSEENYIFVNFRTDHRKKFRFGIGSVYSQAKENNFSLFRTDLTFSYQPNSSLSLSIQPSYSNHPNQTQYVTTLNLNQAPRYILGRLDNEILSASIRLDYILNPSLSIQYYGQPFIFKATYDQFKYVTNPIADKLEDRFNKFENNQLEYTNSIYSVDEDLDSVIDYSFNNPNFSTVQFKSNLVLKWEYQPGSELYFIWAQGINSYIENTENLIEGLGVGLKDKKPNNTFLIKATHRL